MDIKIRIYQKTISGKFELFSFADAYKYNLLNTVGSKIMVRENVYLSVSTNFFVNDREVWTGDVYSIQGKRFTVEYSNKLSAFVLKSNNIKDKPLSFALTNSKYVGSEFAENK